MGHADPRTTRRYDRSRHNLDRHATLRTGQPPRPRSRPPNRMKDITGNRSTDDQ